MVLATTHEVSLQLALSGVNPEPGGQFGAQRTSVARELQSWLAALNEMLVRSAIAPVIFLECYGFDSLTLCGSSTPWNATKNSAPMAGVPSGTCGSSQARQHR